MEDDDGALKTATVITTNDAKFRLRITKEGSNVHLSIETVDTDAAEWLARHLSDQASNGCVHFHLPSHTSLDDERRQAMEEKRMITRLN